MKIRSITYFLEPGLPVDEASIKKAGNFLKAARREFDENGYEVETVRLATVSFVKLISQQTETNLIQLAQRLQEAAAENGIDYVSLGPALPEAPNSYQLIPAALAETETIFFSGILAGVGGDISLPAIKACGNIIHQAASLSSDGFANLRFAALANVPAGSPFFPAAFHGGGDPAFAIATAAADLAVGAFGRASSLEEARQDLIYLVEMHGQDLTSRAGNLVDRHGIPFKGIDFSLAPFPEEMRSLGKAMENLGVSAVGRHGSLAAAALLAESVDRARFPHTGFSGLMLPVLEDAVLAKRAAEGVLSVKDLLLYSAVCGTGLDTVPLPGDASPGQLSSVLLDLAVLAQRLDKPLTARLMPIPGKSAGDPTGFDFAYFANSRVMALDALPLQGMFAGDESFRIGPRQA